MKEEILKLRDEGKTYNEIKEILGCSKGTISYHCGVGQKEKNRNRVNKRRSENILLKKVDNYKYRKPNESIKKKSKKTYQNERVRKFLIREKGNYDKNLPRTFKWQDVIEKFGDTTECYLSGEKINLHENMYNLDHIIPVSKGGDNSFINLGITHEVVNRMKGDLLKEELIDWCKKILQHDGYTIS